MIIHTVLVHLYFFIVKREEDEDLSKGAIAGIVIAVLVIVIFVIIAFWLKRPRRMDQSNLNPVSYRANIGNDNNSNKQSEVIK